MMRRRALLIGGGLGALALGGAGVAAWRRMRAAADTTEYADGLRDSLPLPASDHDLLHDATLAANGHNTQPKLTQIKPAHRES